MNYKVCSLESRMFIRYSSFIRYVIDWNPKIDFFLLRIFYLSIHNCFLSLVWVTVIFKLCVENSPVCLHFHNFIPLRQRWQLCNSSLVKLPFSRSSSLLAICCLRLTLKRKIITYYILSRIFFWRLTEYAFIYILWNHFSLTYIITDLASYGPSL